MFTLSICIPTYNRASHLENCLSSLIQCGLSKQSEVQICISDNCSTDDTKRIISEAGKFLTIKYRVNLSNLGSARNFLEVVQMADGHFVWMLGDDDLLMPGAWEKVVELIRVHKLVDYFYINANHLTTEYVQKFPQPFDLKNLPETMKRFSSRTESGKVAFLKLIDPSVSFDFLGGIFLSVFRRSMWLTKVSVLDKNALGDARTWGSCFDNTFPHVKILANAFSNSMAYFSANPASVCLTGAREWGPMFPLIKSVRLVEALDEYRLNGLSLIAYCKCKNAALDTFMPDILRLIFNSQISGGYYVNYSKVLASSCVYPNFYLSAIYPLFRKVFWIKIGTMLLKFISLYKVKVL